MPVPTRAGTFSLIDLMVRIGVAGLGVAALAWTLFAFPLLWQQSSVEQLARRVIAGDPFRPAMLSAMAPTLDELSKGNTARPSILSSVADIRVRLLDQAVAEGDQAALDARSSALHKSVQAALSQAPADAFLWTVLFWLENSREGFNKSHLKYLRMSYATGPNEGWIGIKRNRLALALYRQLDEKLAASAVSEFRGLVESRFIPQAADILTGPGWPVRDILLPRLEGVELAQRQQFARTVYRLGYDILVPGVEPRGQRPWD